MIAQLLTQANLAFNLLLVQLNNYLWSYILPVTIPLLAIFLIFKLRLIPFRFIGTGICQAWRGRKRIGVDGEITPFQALATAVGTCMANGNIAGVAIAILLGGPGAIFWMWVFAIVCMVVKYAEIVLSVHFRKHNDEGLYMGGPMYYMRYGLHKRWHFLAGFFAIATLLAGLSIGNMQQSSLLTNSVQFVVAPVAHVFDWVVGILLGVFVTFTLCGRIQRIATWATRLTVTMTAVYLIVGIYFLLTHLEQIPATFSLILQHALHDSAAAGGVAGYTVWAAIRMGIERGLFSNESGFGTVGMIHATAETDNPAKQGLIGILGNLIDTLLVCSLTAFIILASGAWQASDTFSSVALVNTAFTSFLPYGQYFVAALLVLFSLTTILGWSYYCESCFHTLFGAYYVILFRIAWIVALVVGAGFEFEILWLFSNIMNAFMALPNLLAVLLLSPLVYQLSKKGIAQLRNAG